MFIAQIISILPEKKYIISIAEGAATLLESISRITVIALQTT